MNKHIREIPTYMKNVLLTRQERDAMYIRLKKYADTHPVRDMGVVRQLEHEGSVVSSLFYQSLSKQHMSIVTGLIIAVLLGGGTSVAAEQAVPGDFLYTVKTEVNENVRGAFAFDAESKAKWKARLAERRLEEAERLAAEGRLNASTNAQLRERFERRVREAEEHAKALESDGQGGLASSARSNLEARLEAHGNVISAIATNIRGRGDVEVSAQVDELLVAVRAHAQEASGARVRAEASEEASIKTQAAAEAKIAAAERMIAQAKRALDSLGSDLRAELAVQAQAQLDVANQNITAAKAEVEAEAFANAFMLAQEAQRIAIRVLVFAQNRNVINISTGVGIGIGVEGGRGTADENVREDSQADDGSSLQNRRDDEVRGNGGDGIRVDVDAQIDAGADVDAGGTGASGSGGVRGRGIIDLVF